MNVLDRLLGRLRPEETGPGRPATAVSPDDDPHPIAGYDRLSEKEIVARMSGLSQVELAAAESYERSHQARPAVLDKLRYLHTPEPLPDYDTLGPEQIAEALSTADAATIRAVRDYERRFARREQVLQAAAEALPTAPASAGEDRAREEMTARVREGFAGRGATADRLAESKGEPSPEDRG